MLGANKSPRYVVSSDKAKRLKSSRNWVEPDYSFKLSKFKNVPSKIRHLMTQHRDSGITENKENA